MTDEKNNVKKEESPNKVKRFSITKEEREKIQNIQSVIGILALQREGMQNSMYMEMTKLRIRFDIKASDAPEGYVRNFDFDMDTFEVLVVDSPKEAIKPVETKN